MCLLLVYPIYVHNYIKLKCDLFTKIGFVRDLEWKKRMIYL